MTKKSLSAQDKRQKRIIELLQRDGHVRVIELSEALEVSEITIRRDLDYLDKKHLIERTFGGAISTARLPKEVSFSGAGTLPFFQSEPVLTVL